MQKMKVRSLGQEDSLEEGMATLSSILAWKIPWTEEPDRLKSIGSQTVRHNWACLMHSPFIANLRKLKTRLGAASQLWRQPLNSGCLPQDQWACPSFSPATTGSTTIDSLAYTMSVSWSVFSKSSALTRVTTSPAVKKTHHLLWVILQAKGADPHLVTYQGIQRVFLKSSALSAWPSNLNFFTRWFSLYLSLTQISFNFTALMVSYPFWKKSLEDFLGDPVAKTLLLVQGA